MSTVAVSSIPLDDMASYMARTINESIEQVEEISRTKPVVDLKLARNDTDGLVVVASVEFPSSEHLSPMEFAEQLIAAELIKVMVNKQLGR